MTAARHAALHPGAPRRDAPAMRLLPALLLALLPLTAAAQPAPAIPAGTPYAAARERLLAAGWQPARLSDADGCAAWDERCRRYPEANACSGTGQGNCLFRWRRGATLVGVVTAGEEPVVRTVRCQEGCGAR